MFIHQVSDYIVMRWQVRLYIFKETYSLSWLKNRWKMFGFSQVEEKLQQTSVQVDLELRENNTHILKRSNKDMQVGGRNLFSSKTHQLNSTVSVHEWEAHTDKCQRECSLWGCKYLGLFTKSFTADLFLCSNDLNAFCLRLPHGNSFRKLDPSHVVGWFTVTRVVFLSQPFLIISRYPNHIAVMKALQRLFLSYWRLTCLHFPQRTTSACLQTLVTVGHRWRVYPVLFLVSPKQFSSHKISSFPWVISILWYHLTSHYPNIKPTLWRLTFLSFYQVFWH